MDEAPGQTLLSAYLLPEVFEAVQPLLGSTRSVSFHHIADLGHHCGGLDQFGHDLCGYCIGVGENRQEQVLGADVLVTEIPGYLGSRFDDSVATRCRPQGSSCIHMEPQSRL